MQISLPWLRTAKRPHLPAQTLPAREPSSPGLEDVCEFGNLRPQASPELSLKQFARTPAQKGSTDEVLQKMRPYIKDVFVVADASGSAPPVLGGKGVENSVELPRELREVPSKRWVITPQIEASHQNLLAEKSIDELRSENREI